MTRERRRRRRSRGWSLTTRVFASTAAIVCVVTGAALIFGSASLRKAGDEAATRGLEQSADLVAQFLAGRERSLAGGARVFVQGPYFRTLVTERRRDDILDQAFEAVERLTANWVMITDGRGVLLAKSDEPRLVGDSLGEIPLVAGALRGGVTTGFGVSRDSALFQAVAVPVVIPGGSPVGVLVATRLVDSLFAADVKAATASDVVFYARDTSGNIRIAASTLGRDSDVVAAATATAGKKPSADGTRPTVRVHGGEYFAQAASLTTAGGDPIGGFAVLRSRDAELTSISGVRTSLVIAGVIGFVLALASAYYSARQVTRPVRALSNAVRRAAEGDYHSSISDGTHEPNNDGEIEALASAFDFLLADLRDKETLIATVTGPAALPVAPAAPSRATSGGSQLRSIGSAKGARRTGVLVGPGELLAERYRIEAEIGSGGMGIVYRARDLRIGETIAIKLLRPEIVAADPRAFERFADELRLARRITHRNVVRTHDLGDSDGVPFITMEFVHGTPLSSVIANRGALDASAVVSIGRQLLRGLAAAHEQGVVHGDLKPQNVLIDASGVLKITDFGVARLIRGAVPERQRRAAQAAESSLVANLAGAVVGTPEYMAPEQLLGGGGSPRSDIYAAGIVLYECLIGATPFSADTPVAFMARKLDDVADTAARRVAAIHDAPADRRGELEQLIAGMTQADPELRPDSAADLAESLTQIG